MDYRISRNEAGQEVTTFTVPAAMCGDFAGCHEEPPTCGCRDGKCDWVDSVDDASFGYWHESWGDSPVHEFPCDEPATVLMSHPMDPEPVRLCAEHAAKADQ